MDTVFSHEIVSVIKRACFARHCTTVRPTLLVLDDITTQPLLASVLEELELDSTLSLCRVSVYNENDLQRALTIATVVLVSTILPQATAQAVTLSQKPVLEWSLVTRNACPLFWPAHSIMDFFIVHQDSLVTSPVHPLSQEGEEQ